MVNKVIWSEFAESQLDEIFDHYEKKASIRVAKKFVNDIINEPNRLIKSPHNRTKRITTQRKKN
jgi:plasmid stabilization system protein ParE